MKIDVPSTKVCDIINPSDEDLRKHVGGFEGALEYALEAMDDIRREGMWGFRDAEISTAMEFIAEYLAAKKGK